MASVNSVTVSKDEAIAILQAEHDAVEDALGGWVEKMHAANRGGFEKFCNDVIALRTEEFVGDWPGIGALLILAKRSLLVQLIEHEKATK